MGLLSCYIETPMESHWQAAKQILRYIKGTLNFGIYYACGEKFELKGYLDSDWGCDLVEKKITTGYMFFGSSTSFSWSSKKQSIVALSSCETEYVATASTVYQAIWLKNLLGALKHPQHDPVQIYVDNVSTIKLAKNPVQYGRSKHIDTRFHFI